MTIMEQARTDDGIDRDDPVFSVKDIARRLNMSKEFVYREVASGKLEFYSIGGSDHQRGRIRISEQQFQDYLFNRKGKQANRFVMPCTSNAARFTQKPQTVSNKLNQLLSSKKKPAKRKQVV